MVIPADVLGPLRTGEIASDDPAGDLREVIGLEIEQLGGLWSGDHEVVGRAQRDVELVDLDSVGQLADLVQRRSVPERDRAAVGDGEQAAVVAGEWRWADRSCLAGGWGGCLSGGDARRPTPRPAAWRS